MSGLGGLVGTYDIDERSGRVTPVSFGLRSSEGITSDAEMIKQPMDSVAYKDLATKQVFLAKPATAATMTKEEYYKFVEGTFDNMLALIKRKNKDYSGPGTDPFANFRRSMEVGVDPINGIAVRFLDKVARIESFFKAGKLENESFEDAWLDVIGYACLALGMLHERSKYEPT
jgi:phosphomannomutase